MSVHDEAMRRLWVLMCTTVLATPASAESEADAQFRRGRELIAKGRLEEACEAFAQSQRTQPRVATLLNLADCWEQRGMFASAHEAFVQARVLARERSDTRRAAEAERRIVALEPRIAPTPTHATEPPTPLPAASSAPPSVDAQSSAVAVERARRFGIGALVGMNVQRESLLFGVRVIGALAAPGGTIRGSGGFQFSRYNDDPTRANYITRTSSFSASVDYLWVPRPSFALGGGLGFGADYDSVSPVIHSTDPDVERVSDLGSFFAVRATPLSVRLHHGAIEVGLHLAMLIAADEVTFTASFAADWIVW